MALSATLLTVNWSSFVCATISGRLLDASLGYFINPLCRWPRDGRAARELRRLQWIAIGLATSAWAADLARESVPWIALVLAVTFAAYGL